MDTESVLSQGWFVPATRYAPPQDWTVCNAALIPDLDRLTDRHSGWGFWQCCTWLRK